MKKGKFEKNQGITLVALVITIVVLLILAGVALRLVIGENGITERAVKASKTQNIAGAKERLELDIANYAAEFYQAKYVNSDESATSLKGYVLGKIATGENYTVDKKDATTGEIRISIADGTNATCTVGEDGQVSWTGMSTEPVVRWTQEGNNITNGTVTLKIGDKIDYDPSDGATTTTYTSPATKTGWEEDQVFNVSSLAKTLGENWRVFGVDETTGQVLIIPENFVGPTEGGYDLESESGATYYYLQGQDGYVNGVSELNKISDLYGHGKYATSARSINANDVNKITGFDPTGFNEGEIGEYGNEVTYSREGTSTLYYSGKNGVSGSSSEDTFNYYDEKTKTWKSLNSGDTGSLKLINTYYNYTISGIDDAIKRVFGTQGEYGYYFSSKGDSMIYWLGSTCVCNDGGLLEFNLRFVSNDSLNCRELLYARGYKFQDYGGVRPLVSLQNNINLEYNETSQEWQFVE